MNAAGHGHRHTAPGQHEHEFEPQYGLPELLPAGEQILWQGSPDVWSLAVQRFHVRKLVVYFAAILALRVGAQVSEGADLWPALWGALPVLLLFTVAVLLLGMMAWLTARNTVYTLTNRRVVMRIGVVLTLSLNLPFGRVAAASLKVAPDGVGDIALQLSAADRVAYLHLWPHARRWRFAQPEPTLLCVPGAAEVGTRLTQAWRAVQAEATTSARPMAPTGDRDAATGLAVAGAMDAAGSSPRLAPSLAGS